MAHSISEYDTTSSFYGKGKIVALKILMNSVELDDVVETFTNPNSSHDVIFEAGCKFTRICTELQKNLYS